MRVQKIFFIICLTHILWGSIAETQAIPPTGARPLPKEVGAYVGQQLTEEDEETHDEGSKN